MLNLQFGRHHRLTPTVFLYTSPGGCFATLGLGLFVFTERSWSSEVCGDGWDEGGIKVWWDGHVSKTGFHVPTKRFLPEDGMPSRVNRAWTVGQVEQWSRNAAALMSRLKPAGKGSWRHWEGSPSHLQCGRDPVAQVPDLDFAETQHEPLGRKTTYIYIVIFFGSFSMVPTWSACQGWQSGCHQEVQRAAGQMCWKAHRQRVEWRCLRSELFLLQGRSAPTIQNAL